MGHRFNLHFTHLPTIQRVLYTCTLCVLVLGYTFAMIYIVASHHGRDGKPMITVEDIAIAYSGSKTGTKMESALRGPMSGMLPAEENLKIVAWLHAGISEQSYQDEVKTIFDDRCIACHNNRNPHLPPLEDFAGVSAMAEEDTGMDLFSLVRVSHIHLFGLTFIFFIIGGIFIHAHFQREWIKVTLIVTPFVTIIIDVASWYITKYFEPFAYVVIGSGALMGASFMAMFLISIYQMWFYKLPDSVQQRFYCSTVLDGD